MKKLIVVFLLIILLTSCSNEKVLTCNIDNTEQVIHYNDEKVTKAYEDGVVDWPKPISCHLYPIRVSKYEDFDAVNYSRWDICKAACTLGKEHKVAVYEFLKEPLVRKYGDDFYDELDAAAKYLAAGKEQ